MGTEGSTCTGETSVAGESAPLQALTPTRKGSALAAPSFSTQSRNHDRDPPKLPKGVGDGCDGLGWLKSAKIVPQGNLDFLASTGDRSTSRVRFISGQEPPIQHTSDHFRAFLHALGAQCSKFRLLTAFLQPSYSLPTAFLHAVYRPLTTVATGSRSRWDFRLGFSYSTAGLALVSSLSSSSSNSSSSFNNPHPNPTA